MEALSAAAASAGIPVGSQRFLATTVAGPLVGYVLAVIKSVSASADTVHVASTVLGLAQCVFVYSAESTLLLLGPVLLCYALMAAGRRHAGTIVFVASFAYLLFCHVRTASGAAWKEGNIDYTGTLMVFVLKFVSTAMDYTDGGLKTDTATLTAYQQAARLTALPSVLEFLGYVFFPCTLLAGPWMPMADYLAYARRTGVWSPTAKKPPSAMLPALQRCTLGLVCAGIHAVYAPQVPETAFLDASWLQKHRSTLFRLVYMWAMGFTARCKYYFAWTWAHASCMTSGLSWTGYDPSTGRADWSRASNIDVLGVELATSAATFPATWNTRTGLWLRHYCYERLAPPHRGRAPFWALLVTQALSGIWHGVQPGYALFFIGSSFMFHASKVMFRYQRGLTGLALTASNVVHGIIAAFHLNYLAAPFIAITLPAGWASMKAVGFAGHISMVGICILGAVIPPPRDKKTASATSGASPVPAAGGRKLSKKLA